MRFAVVVSTFAGIAIAVVAGQMPAPALPRRPVVYVAGEQAAQRLHSAARIDVHSSSTRGYGLRIIRAIGPKEWARGFCSAPLYQIAEDADLADLYPGTYTLIGTAAKHLSPASAFPTVGDVFIEGGLCYTSVMICVGDATDSANCHVTLKPKHCAPIRNPRFVFVPTVVGC